MKISIKIIKKVLLFLFFILLLSIYDYNAYFQEIVERRNY